MTATETAAHAEPEPTEPVDAGPEPRPRRATALRYAAVAGLGALVVLRFVAHSHLWLDEALTVNVARLPLRRLPDALRHDGAPPLYYVMLHGWMRLFGTGTVAVRALSGLLGVVALPLTFAAGLRAGGRRTAWAAAVLMAASPFAVRYSSEARMYTLMLVLALLGYLSLVEALETPTTGGLAAVAAVTALLLYTHYWSIQLLAVVAVVLAVRARRPAGASARRALVAMAVGALALVPWLPVFVFQLRHTGTPWATNPGPNVLVDTVFDFAGPRAVVGELLGLVLLALAAIGVFGHAAGPGRLELRARPRRGTAELAVVVFGTLLLAMVLGFATRAAFASRYATAVLAPFVLLCGLGIAALPSRRAATAVLAGVVGLGLVGSGAEAATERTAAARVAAALRRSAAPGDVVVYCPDQLGPSVSRLLPVGRYRQLTFPTGAGPERVDWADYAHRNRTSRAAPFASRTLAGTGPTNTLWVVWAPGYRTYKARCQSLISTIGRSRPLRRVIKVKNGYWERAGLVRFRPGAPLPFDQ